MTIQSRRLAHSPRTGATLPSALNGAGRITTRYGLVLVLLWIGAMKFTSYEASGIEPFVANSPLISWLYSLLSLQATSNLIGVVEIVAGLAIASLPLSARFAAIGSAVGVAIFSTTLTFLFTTPGWEASLGGFPALSALPGQFLIKDVVLLGASLCTLADAIAARHSRSTAAVAATVPE
jgi:uncharacterized membrane protein YkgB